MSKLNSPLTLNNDCWQIQNIDAIKICDEQKTPLYTYDINHVVNQYTKLKEIFSYPHVKIYYAMKANYNLHILQALKDSGTRIDTVSPAEVLLCLKLGFKKEDILYTANNLTDDEMDFIYNHDILINIDSLSRLEKFANKYPNSRVCLRFNTNVLAGENAHVQTAGDRTKFGILLKDIDKALTIIAKYNIKVVGLHKHTGSGIADSDKFYESMNNLLSIAVKENFPDLEFIDFGGGLKVSYSPDEENIDYKNFGKKVSDVFENFCTSYGKNLNIYFEPGKYMVAESGILFVQVNTLKENNGRFIAGTDSGFNHLIRPMLYNAYHHIINISNPNGKEMFYDICGNICESGDLFASDRKISEIREGDYLAILNAGAYSFSMASTYNLRTLPKEIVIQDANIRISRDRKSNEKFIDELMREYNL